MTAIPAVRRISTGSPWEEAAGCARAVAAGEWVLVSGTMPPSTGSGDALAADGSPYEQARLAFRGAVAALEPFGLGPASVVRTRTYIAHARDVEDVVRAHREVFGEVRPAATMVVVAGFTDSRVLAEVEIEAYRGGTA